ncbi:MarR family protein [Breoghania corrubedonensis]|uniref:MarR family protein n=1 Tax=Breoghania corrubedonensis TaxID=665038 RepID=A0A2T5UQW5_9HYPH|nr:MarR family transcriptional regulator [Breoghania corrubedonensis]PTW53908.1 MarR family protein [Breoghania corrubedonensis]
MSEPVTDGIWVGVRQLAEMKGVSHPAISKRLRRFEEAGLVTVRREGRRTLVNVAQWDAAADEVTDPARLAGAETTRQMSAEMDATNADAPTGSNTKAYSYQQARKAEYDADLKEIELAKQRGQLLPIAEVEDAMIRCAESLVRAIDQLPAGADDLAAAVSRGGVPALRDALKIKARELRLKLAEKMRLLGEDESDGDEE